MSDEFSMVERVARDLRFVMYGVPPLRPLEKGSTWLIYAKTAIKSMREPTTEMLGAAHRNNHPRDIETWRTMIDEALKTSNSRQ